MADSEIPTTARTTGSPLLELHALGTLYVRLDGAELKLPFSAQRLLIYLAIKGPVIERSSLAGVLYSESSEARALGNLRTLVSRTKHLVPDHLRSDRTEVRLEGRFWADANHVDTGDILSLRFRWRGAFLEGHGTRDTLYDEWVRRKRVRIEQRFTARLHAAMSQAEELHDWARCRELAHFLTDFEPWSETGFRTLLRATYETSGPASAAALYERFTDRLHDEVGVAPSDETAAVAAQLLPDVVAAPRPSHDGQGISPTWLAPGPHPGVPPPPHSSADLARDHLAVRLDESVRAALDTRALEAGVGVDDVVETALRRYLEIPGSPVFAVPHARVDEG